MLLIIQNVTKNGSVKVLICSETCKKSRFFVRSLRLDDGQTTAKEPSNDPERTWALKMTVSLFTAPPTRNCFRLLNGFGLRRVMTISALNEELCRKMRQLGCCAGFLQSERGKRREEQVSRIHVALIYLQGRWLKLGVHSGLREEGGNSEG